MRIVKAIMMAGTLALAAGCSIYKDYKRPEVNTYADIYGSSDTTSIATIGWEDFFTDPQLKTLIKTGLENNADYRIAGQKVLEAQASLRAANLVWLPSLGFSPSAGITSSEERYNGLVNNYSVPLNVSWEIDLTGKNLNNGRKAKAVLEQSEVYRKSVQTELISSIAQCYYTLLKLDAQLRVSTSTAKNWKENVRIMKAMKEAGMTNEASVSSTEANSYSIDASLFDLKYQITQTENTMALLLGVAPRSFERGRLKEAHLGGGLECGVPAQLLSRRPDVQYAELELKKAYYDRAIAKAAFYPSLTLTGEAGWEKALTSPAGWLFSAGAGLVQPIFCQGKLRANSKIAEARQEEARIAFEKSILKAGTEVNTALALCSSAKNKTDIRKGQIEALESAVASTKALMRHSESTYLEVLTAQQSLLSARLLQISDEYDALIGTISLYKALGGGAN